MDVKVLYVSAGNKKPGAGRLLGSLWLVEAPGLQLVLAGGGKFWREVGRPFSETADIGCQLQSLTKGCFFFFLM